MCNLRRLPRNCIKKLFQCIHFNVKKLQVFDSGVSGSNFRKKKRRLQKECRNLRKEIKTCHLSGRTNLDVRGVNYQNQRITFIPTDMNRFFPNLEGLLFNECPIRSFSRENLRPFPRLRDFSIHSGELTTVSRDVFQNAPGLQFANLGRNSIANIGPGIKLRNYSNKTFATALIGGD